jgi:uncharacterized membrane protein (DUF2068 family)
MMRRAMAWLAVCGAVALLAAWPLWHVTRADTSGCTLGIPCDPALYLPFGSLALWLTIGGLLALLVVATSLVAVFLRGVIRHDAGVRAARRAAGGRGWLPSKDGAS